MFFEFDDFDVRDRFYAIEEKTERLKLTLEMLPPHKIDKFHDMCARAHVYHDSALDGLVISPEEITTIFASDDNSSYLRSRILLEIRNHRDLLDHLRTHKKRARILNELHHTDHISYNEVSKIHSLFYDGLPRKEPGQLRSTMPLHSAYFHLFYEPKEIEKALDLLCTNTKHQDFQAQHPINQAVLFHHQFMQILPFTEGSGKVARFFMNSFLLQGSYDMAIIHGSERQSYYETLRDGPEAFRALLLDSMEAGLDSQLKFITDNDMTVPSHRVVTRTVTGW